jgi:hypothetical protein
VKPIIEAETSPLIETAGAPPFRRHPRHQSQNRIPGRGTANKSRQKAAASPRRRRHSNAIVVAGMIALVQEWLKNGMDAPVSEMAKMLTRLMREELG